MNTQTTNIPLISRATRAIRASLRAGRKVLRRLSKIDAAVADATEPADPAATAVLAGNVRQIERAIDTGSFDDHLERLRHTETETSTRPGVLQILDSRQRDVDIEAVLEGTLADLDQALKTGDYDECLERCAVLERAGKNRKGAASLFAARRRKRDALAVLDGTVPELTDYLARTPEPPLELLENQERCGKNRTTALAAIRAAS